MKRLEIALKTLAAWLLAALFWRPGRSTALTARLSSAKRILLVRVDNRVGEALLTTPLVHALAGRTVDVLAHPKCVRVLEGLEGVNQVISASRAELYLGVFSKKVRAVRAARYDVVVNAGNWTGLSVASALWARLAAPHGVVLGPAISAGSGLSDVPVAPRTDTTNEVAQRLHLLSPLGVDASSRRLRFRAPRVTDQLAPLVARLRERPHVVVNPGGRLAERRVPLEAFAAAIQALERPALITWGPGEQTLADQLLVLVPQATLAPPTDLDALAALFQAAQCTVCNNTGPMHLSVAVGAPTLAFFVGISPERWGHAFSPHQMVDLTPHVTGNVRRAAAEAARAFLATLPLPATGA